MDAEVWQVVLVGSTRPLKGMVPGVERWKKSNHLCCFSWTTSRGMSKVSAMCFIRYQNTLNSPIEANMGGFTALSGAEQKMQQGLDAPLLVADVLPHSPPPASSSCGWRGVYLTVKLEILGDVWSLSVFHWGFTHTSRARDFSSSNVHWSVYVPLASIMVLSEVIKGGADRLHLQILLTIASSKLDLLVSSRMWHTLKSVELYIICFSCTICWFYCFNIVLAF